MLFVEEMTRKNVEYRLLPFQFLLLTCLGVWRPKNWSVQAKNIHNMYFILLSFINSVICLEMFIYLVRSFGTDKFKLINFFMASVTITGVYKSVKFMQNRETIRSFIVNFFNHQWMNLQDSNEKKINEKFNSKLRCVY